MGKKRLGVSRAFIVAVGLLAGGCYMVPVHVTGAPPSDYRQLSADGKLAATLRANPAFGPLEISGLKKTVLTEPGDWRACLRTMKLGRPVYFAVFFVGDVIESGRRSVVIDSCEQEQQFVALPPPMPIPKSEPGLRSN